MIRKRIGVLLIVFCVGVVALSLVVNTSLSANRSLGNPANNREDWMTSADYTDTVQSVEPPNLAAVNPTRLLNRGSGQPLRAQTDRNLSDGVHAVTIALRATHQVLDILRRQMELAAEAVSDDLSSKERDYMLGEFEELSDEMACVALQTTFGNMKLTDGTHRRLQIHVGRSDGFTKSIQMELGDLRRTSLKDNAGFEHATEAAIDTCVNGKNARIQLGGMLNVVDGYCVHYTKVVARLESFQGSLKWMSGAAQDHDDGCTIHNAAAAQASAVMSTQYVLAQAGDSVRGQANGVNSSALRLI